MLTDATKSLIEAARDSMATDADIDAAAQQFFDAVSSASRDQANAAMRSLSSHCRLENPSRGAYLALVCGVLIERGCDPQAIAIAVFSFSPESRSSARHLRDLATQISDYHEAGHWLQLMLGVLDNEPVVVIEPETTLGIVGRISGVVDNFQLNVLLMDCFPKSSFLARRRVPQAVAAIARGNGPQQSHHTVTSVWNLYTWEAIEPEAKLPDPSDYGSSAHWVWNEGTPADIPVFDGRRVVLLGPASYQRSWRSQRMFDNLPAKLEVERKLTKDEVNLVKSLLGDRKRNIPINGLTDVQV